MPHTAPVPQSPPAANEQDSVTRFTFDRLAAFLLFLAIFGAACLMPAQSDTFWQLRAGAETVASGHVQLRDTFTHTVRGTYWPNHEWGAEVAFYLLHRLGGFPLLTFVLSLVVVGAWWLTWRLMRGSTRLRVVIVAVLAVSSARLWSLRPQVLSLFLLAAAVTLLVKQRELWLMPLFTVWANLHGGVVLGFAAVAGALLGAAVIEPARWRRFVVVVLGCAAATCASPLGLSLWTEVPDMLQRLQQYQVAEWQRTSLVDPWNLPYWTVCVVVPLLTWRRRHSLQRQDALVIGASLTLLLLGGRTTRNVMPALMITAAALSRLLAKGATPSPAIRRERPLFNAAVAGAATVGVVAWVAAGWGHGADRLQWEPMSGEAIRAVAQCRPPLYNLYDHGGFITWLAPAQPVFVDSRQDPFPPQLILDQITAESTGDYRDLFARYQIGCAVLPPGSKVAQRLTTDGWRVAYRDARWVVLEAS